MSKSKELLKLAFGLPIKDRSIKSPVKGVKSIAPVKGIKKVAPIQGTSKGTVIGSKLTSPLEKARPVSMQGAKDFIA